MKVKYLGVEVENPHYGLNLRNYYSAFDLRVFLEMPFRMQLKRWEEKNGIEPTLWINNKHPFYLRKDVESVLMPDGMDLKNKVKMREKMLSIPTYNVDLSEHFPEEVYSQILNITDRKFRYLTLEQFSGFVTIRLIRVPYGKIYLNFFNVYDILRHNVVGNRMSTKDFVDKVENGEIKMVKTLDKILSV